MANISKIKLPGSDTAYDLKDTVSGYVATEATTSAKGLMSSADKTKLNGIASGAEVNQNAFSNVVVGTTTVAADSKTDSLTLEGGANITLTPDATNDKITISLDDTVDTGEVIATDVQAGNLIVNGTSRFLNTINGDISGNSATATKLGTSTVGSSITPIYLNGGTPTAISVDTTVTSGSSKLVTSGAVSTAIANLPEPMIFKGSLGTGGTITTLPTASAENEGFTYKVITAGTYASQSAKVGDTFISDGSAWVLIPSGDEPSGTVTSVAISATSPIAINDSSAITTSGTRTISHANSGVTAGTYRSVTVNATGHVTAGTNPTTLSGYGITDAKIASGTITLGSNTITPLTSSSSLDATKLSGTIPSGCYADTKNTAGSTDTSSKIYLIGATSQAANPQTYSDDQVTVTSGVLSTNGHTSTGNISLSSANGDSPCLNFLRGSTLTKWRMYCSSGQLKLDSSTDGSTWVNRAYFADNSGNLNLSSVSATGALSAGSTISAGSGVNCNTANSGTSGGLSLYSTDPTAYGVTMRIIGTASGFDKHGYVQGDWAGYFNFSGAVNRGWIYRHAGSNVTSISGDGNIVTNGSLTLGGNATNTSGVRQVYNSTTQSIDFVFAS